MGRNGAHFKRMPVLPFKKPCFLKSKASLFNINELKII